MHANPRLKRESPAPNPGIVHLGPGAFFRAFNAVYTDEVMTAHGGDWGIVAVSLRSSTARDQMQPQNGVYSSVTLTENGMQPRTVGAIVDVLVAPENPEQVVAAMADPAIRIVSLTITEKGYCHSPATGRLALDHPDISHDLTRPDTPRSAIGFIVAALDKRRRVDNDAFTVLSCDNLPSNGALIKQMVLDFARARSNALSDWIEANATFPSTMVDRITPATTDDDIKRLGEQTGYHDPAAVMHEGFRQWVIEDNFASGRPGWETAGAQMVACVDAHETMKLRCLNGTHSALAYLGYLAGFETISDTVADTDMARFCEMLWAQEILPTVAQPEGEDLTEYCAKLMQRYRDRAIRHRTWQIAMDGSQKLPQRLLGTIRDRLDAGAVPQGLCLAVAAWMRYVGGVDENGNPIDVRDPLSAQLRAACDKASTPAEKADALLAFREIFGEDLPRRAAFRDTLIAFLTRLEAQGAQETVRFLLTA